MTEKTSTSSQAPAPPPPGRYRLESDRGTIHASARAMFGLFTVTGTFRIRDGEICIAEDPAACTARATIDASSYDSGNARRNRDVSSPALLDTGRFPDISFTGTGGRAEHDSWAVDGSVSAHDATDTIQVRVSEARAEGYSAYFLATARLDRTRLGVSGKKGIAGRSASSSTARPSSASATRPAGPASRHRSPRHPRLRAFSANALPPEDIHHLPRRPPLVAWRSPPQ